MMSMRKELNEFLELEMEKKRQSWKIDIGEEAKITNVDQKINTMLALSNGTIAVSAYQVSSSNNIIEIYDS